MAGLEKQAEGDVYPVASPRVSGITFNICSLAVKIDRAWCMA